MAIFENKNKAVSKKVNKKVEKVENKTNVKIRQEKRRRQIKMINKNLSGCKKIRKQKGITLIALVVTIVVLIILATVSILAVFGDNGIIARAQTAKDTHEEGKADETNTLDDYASYIGNYLDGKGGNQGGSDTPKDPTEKWNLDKVNKVKSEDNIVVPVPKGYTASTVEGEKSVSSGFVIKEGSNGAATEGINEFVWVPVGNISDIYDEANNAGQLLNFGTSSSPKNPAVKRTYPTTQNSGYREPDVVTYASSGSDSTSGSEYDAVSTNLQQAGLLSTATASTLKTQLQNEFNEMIKSVKTYGGFYIGRYETGNLSQSKAVVQKNNTDIGGQTWYTMYKVCKTIKANENVETSMIWGCQWDATLRWMQTSTNSEVANFPTNSEGKGNYHGTQGDTAKVIPTGSNSAYAVNNIYDMAGNVFDWTLEAPSATDRVFRGGNSGNTASSYPASDRGFNSPTYSDSRIGSRSTLYVR